MLTACPDCALCEKHRPPATAPLPAARPVSPGLLEADLKTLRSALLRVSSKARRSQQRVAALWIAKRFEGDSLSAPIPTELLRSVCRQLEIYDTAVFTYYMADLRPLREGAAIARPWFYEIRPHGWGLTTAGIEDANALLGRFFAPSGSK